MVLVASESFGQLSLSLVATKQPCPGQNDGVITATATSGTPPYAYRLGRLGIPGAGNVFTGLVEASDTIYVTDADLTEVSAVIEMKAVTITLANTRNYTCIVPATPTGAFDVVLEGGNLPYGTPVVTTGVVQETFPYHALAAGTYLINVIDNESCVATEKSFTVTEDVIPPTCVTYPQHKVFTTADYQALTHAAVDFDLGFAGYICTGGLQDPKTYAEDTMTYSFDARTYERIQFKMEASQTGVATWDGTTDFLKVRARYNGGAWENVILDYCQWEAHTAEVSSVLTCSGQDSPLATAWIDLTNAAGKQIEVQVICVSTANTKNYTISNVQMRGNNTLSIISPAVAGAPVDCEDLLDPEITPTYTDGPITWRCVSPVANMEFSFTRTWTIKDDCDNAVLPVKTQLISVGSYPVFGTVRDTIIDFCRNENVIIAVPPHSDNCATITNFKWSVKVLPSNTLIDDGVGATTLVDLPQPTHNDSIYVITWTITDDAGIEQTAEQNITVKPQVHVRLQFESPADGHFCTGNEAQFRISFTGGTGSYSVPMFTPVGTGATPWLPDDATNASGIFTTTNLALVTAPDLQVDVADINIVTVGGIDGGCPASKTFYNTDGTPVVGDYFIHEKITTNSIIRVP